MIDRRSLVKAVAASSGVGLAAPLASCGGNPFPGELGGADMARGHRLRKQDFPAPSATEKTGIAIIGGGVAGLTAAWMLREAGYRDFRLFELENTVGGNARSGKNAISAYPLGAHYLPVPNQEARSLRHMLGRIGLITGEADSKPVYDETALCADLQERLFWRGKWQEGLFPQNGLTAKDRADRAAFDARMKAFSAQVGQDGKPAFASPMAYSSQDATLQALDQQSFAHWIAQQGWTSPILLSHIRYCCRDDYGTEPDQVSAWAGIHYFAARRGWAAGNAGDNELTWPQGNGWLVNAMAQPVSANIQTGRTVFRVLPEQVGLQIDSQDHRSGKTIRTHVKAAILATPHFITRRLMPGLTQPPGLSYAPWIVANISVDRPPAGKGVQRAWDNVSTASESLGYVIATHQSASAGQGPTVLTWYMALSRMEPADARRLMIKRPLSEWQAIIRDDLLAMNPDLAGAIRRIDVWRWGHAMVRPVPGFVSQVAMRQGPALAPDLFHAHSDMSGLSLFEEAHYRGTAAAEAAMRHVNHPFESLL
jgi:hypothetical protein